MGDFPLHEFGPRTVLALSLSLSLSLSHTPRNCETLAPPPSSSQSAETSSFSGISVPNELVVQNQGGFFYTP